MQSNTEIIVMIMIKHLHMNFDIKDDMPWKKDTKPFLSPSYTMLKCSLSEKSPTLHVHLFINESVSHINDW